MSIGRGNPRQTPFIEPLEHCFTAFCQSTLKLRPIRGEITDNQPNISLRACIFDVLAGGEALLSLSKLQYNLEGAA